MLTFVNGFLLLGGLLIAVPVVLHLIMRQQPKYLEFPALRFLQQRKESNRRKLLLRHLLLLALRCLAILLLALTLARPTITSSRFLPGGDEPAVAALVFDTSARMEYRHRNATRLEEARRFAFELLPQLPRESQLVVLDSAARRSEFDVDVGAARLRVERLATGSRGRPLGEMLDNALRMVQSGDLPRKELFLFTDLARVAWSDSALADWNRRVAAHPEIAFHVIDVGVEEPVNYSLGDVSLSEQVISRNGTLTIETTLSALGAGGNRTVSLYLLDEQGRPQRRDETLLELQAGESQFVEFRLAGLEIGTHHGFLAIEGSDGLAADDRRYFSFEVAPAWRVLIASPAPVERYGGILRFALAPPELRQKGIARFECEIVPQDRLAEMPLTPYDAVWLLDPEPLRPSVWQRLAGYVAGGGGVAIVLGGNAGRLGRIDPSFNDSAAAEMLPAEITRPWRAASADVYLAPRSLEHPLFAPFKALDGDVPWYEFPIFRYWSLGPPVEQAQVLAEFSDGAPALLERPLGQGRVLTLVTSLTDLPADSRGWNYLLTGPDAWPGFVLVTEMARYLVGSIDQRFNFLVGQQVDLPLPQGEQFDTYWLTTPPPAEDRITTSPLRPENRLVITSTDSPGTYRLEAGGERGVRRGFSVNLPAEATQLERIGQTAVNDLTAADNVDLARDPQSIERMLAGIGSGTAPLELYPWLLVLVVAVIAAEQLVSSLFYRKK